MKLSLTCLLLSFALVGCDSNKKVVVVANDSPSTEGSGVEKTESRPVDPFTAIKVTAPCRVEVLKGDAVSVEVTADDNLLPVISTLAKDGTLTVANTGSFSSRIGIRVKIAAPKLSRIELSSASKLKAEGVPGGDTELIVGGASELTWSGEAKRLRLIASGASKATLTGKAEELSANLDGASSLFGFEAVCAEGNVRASGASSAEVNITGPLSATARGASTILYTGDPRVRMDSQEASTVRAK